MKYNEKMHQKSQAVEVKRGLLARAEAIRAAEEKKAMKKAKFQKRVQKLRRLAIGTVMGVLLPAALHTTTLSPNRQLNRAKLDLSMSPATQQAIEKFQREHQQNQHHHISEAERNLMAQMVYGEAGRGIDPFEVIHTALNRMSSPLFPNNMTSIITAKNQYVGYKASNPVTKEYRRMVDIAVDEWELNGGVCVDDCKHFYFVTGIQGDCNRFEISEDGQGRWVNHSEKKYEKLHRYCDVAVRQNAQYRQEVRTHQFGL